MTSPCAPCLHAQLPSPVLTTPEGGGRQEARACPAAALEERRAGWLPRQRSKSTGSGRGSVPAASPRDALLSLSLPSCPSLVLNASPLSSPPLNEHRFLFLEVRKPDRTEGLKQKQELWAPAHPLAPESAEPSGRQGELAPHSSVTAPRPPCRPASAFRRHARCLSGSLAPPHLSVSICQVGVAVATHEKTRREGHFPLTQPVLKAQQQVDNFPHLPAGE